MNPRQLLGIAIIIIGGIMLFFSNYIAEQVAQGKLQIASGERQVKTMNRAFGQSEYTKPIGGIVTGSAESRIAAGKQEVSYYEDLAQKLQIAGAILLVVGVAAIFFLRKKRQS